MEHLLIHVNKQEEPKHHIIIKTVIQRELMPSEYQHKSVSLVRRQKQEKTKVSDGLLKPHIQPCISKFLQDVEEFLRIS